MYIESTKEVNTLQSNVLTLNTDKDNISSELEKTQKYLTDTDDLRTLQLKERNFLIKELSDQLIAVRRKLFLEDQYNGSRRRSISQDPSSDKKEKLEKKLSMKGKVRILL